MVTTARLTLRPHTTASYERLHVWTNDHEIQALSADRFSSNTPADTQARLARWMRAQDDIIHLAIHLEATDAMVGFLHVALIEPEHQRCRIGIVVGEKSLWGRGLGTEALAGAVEYCFTDLGMNRIGAEAYATNPASARMLEKVGFVREGVLRESIMKDGGFVDEYQYGLLRREWAPARADGR